MPTNLPDPRPDGTCCRCNWRAAVTRDGRFCRRCLADTLDELDPPIEDPPEDQTEDLDRRHLRKPFDWPDELDPDGLEDEEDAE